MLTETASDVMVVPLAIVCDDAPENKICVNVPAGYSTDAVTVAVPPDPNSLPVPEPPVRLSAST